MVPMPRPDAAATTRAALLDAARAELAQHGEAARGLRATARRAGLSHAAPTYVFGSRAGLLTALAADGFRMLGDRLAGVAPTDGDAVAALGRVYLDFGAEHPALIDLMFRRHELHADDPELADAKRAALAHLAAAVGDRTGGDERWTLISWALVHGLVVLGREGVVAPLAGRAPGEDLAVARDLVAAFAADLPTGARRER
jgi:AcrR family transcriptional regulator